MINRAIMFEDGRTEVEHAQGVHGYGVELFIRGVQANAGWGFGVLVFGVAMGTLFAVLFCLIYGDMCTRGSAKNLGELLFSVLLTSGAFVAVYLVPFVKYPP
ncbi:CbtA family protein [Mycobacterium uberis]|uniref:CbtA family protein n=1 Tax=Mycobacterium uberis TaxID=2162698 RepID=UPI001FB30868